jgi:hypothetical protein
LAIFCKFGDAAPCNEEKILQHNITIILIYAFVAF